MSLLANVNQPNDKGYYFAFDTTPETDIVTAQGFVATGGDEAGPAGTFSARGDAVPGGLAMFNITRPNGAITWSMGLDGTVPFDTSGGNNLAFYSYDNSGAFLGAPMTIQRNIGEVQIFKLNAGNALIPGTTSTTTLNVTTGGATVGGPAMAGGGVVNILGASGTSRVYDNEYNPPFGAEVVLGQFSRTGVSVLSTPFTAAKTGLYSLTMSVNIDANGLVWTPGTTGCIAYATLGGGGGTLSDSYLACDGIMLPSGTVPPIGAANVYIKDLVAIVTLNAGESVTASLYTQGAMDLGVAGAVTVYIQPLVA